MSRSPDDQKSSSPVVKVKETKNRQTPPKEPREAQPTEIPVPVPSQPVVQGSEHVVGDPKQEADGLINQSKQRPGSGLISSGDQIAKKRDKDRRGISRSKTVGDGMCPFLLVLRFYFVFFPPGIPASQMSPLCW